MKMKFNIMLVEDCQSDIDTFSTTIERLNDSQSDYTYVVDVAKTIADAETNLKSSEYQGCVVDIKLSGSENGNDVIKSIMDNYRLPVVIFTGTPDVDSTVKCFTKGKESPEEVISEIKSEIETGLFSVIGGKGVIEKYVNHIFWDILYPQIDIWEKYNKEGVDTEQILLRYSMANLIEQMDENGPLYCTEEMYIYGDRDKPIKTGAIFTKKATNVDYVLLSPPCDLVIRDDTKDMNTDTLILCEIEPISHNWAEIKSGSVDSVIQNKSQYYHWLPDNALYSGGRLNFRKIVSCPKTSFNSEFMYKDIKIGEMFVKSILNRFSAYYARQGQPDFDFDKEVKKRKEMKTE